MKKLINIFLMFLLLSGLFIDTAFAGDTKKAQTGMKFLSVSTDARAGGLSNALTARELGASSLLYNPAGMAGMTNFMNTSFGQLDWIADIGYKFGTVAIRPEKGAYGVFGISFFTVDYGNLLGAIRANNSQGFLETGNFSPTAFSVGIGYATFLTDKFSVGGHVKYVKQNLVGSLTGFNSDQSPTSKNFSADVLAFDFGLLYKTGFKSLTFGMNIRNFSQEIKFQQELFQLPLTFEMGLVMNMGDLFDLDVDQHSIVVSLDATHPRDVPEQIEMGIEYTFSEMFSLRMGYTSPIDEQGLSYGVGFNQELNGYNVGFDYAYTPFGVFNEVQRFTIELGL